MTNLLRSVVLAALLGTVASAPAFAQSPTIGFKLGPSFSTISGDEFDDVGTLTRFTGGGFVRFDMGSFGVQPELMFVTKGGKSDDFDPDLGDVSFELRLDYIEIPVLLTVPLTSGPGIAPFLYGGPAFAVEVGCTFAFESDGFSVSESCDEEDDESIDRKKFDIGAMIGAGISIPAGPGALLLEGRYNFGLINLNDGEDPATVRNRSGAVLVGYSMPIGRR